MAKRYQGGILGAGFNPLQAPNAPTGVTAVKGNQSATVSFTAPSNVGGSAITGYVGQSSPGGISATGASSPLTFSGLTNGTPYTFTVTALNSYGPSPAGGPSNSATPVESYWIALFGASGQTDYGNGIAVDDSGNVYVCGSYSVGTATLDFSISKYNASGAIQWQRRLGGSGSDEDCRKIAVDASGNVYVCGNSNASGSYDFQIAKYNTSGVIQWQRRLGDANGDEANGIAVDSSGNVYVCGQSNSGTADFQIAKYNTSGAIQWQRRLGDISSNDFGSSIAVDSSGNVYACGYSDAGGSNYFQIVKYNSSGTLQWQQKLGGSALDAGFGIAVDSSGNAYVCGYSRASGNNDFQIAKYNTSGALQWQRRLGASNTDIARSISVDSSGNVYVCGYSDATSTMDFQIAKYNTSGTLQWQRRLGSGSSADYGLSIAVNSSGTVYVCGYTNVSGTNDVLFAKLPSDGSLTGTYTVGGYNITYATSSLIDTASSLTGAAASLPEAASSLTDAASSLTDAASTLTASVTTI